MIDRPDDGVAVPGPQALSSIRAFAEEQAAELEEFGALLHQLRLAVGEPDVTIDADAVWQRVLTRLDARPDAGPDDEQPDR